MASFIIMEPPEKAGTNPAERTLFVRDGFSLLAFILPFIWLLIHRLWFEAALVLAVAVALGFVGDYWNLGGAVAVLSLLVSILVALEASNWRVAALRRRGYVEKGVIEATDRAEAEIRYFAESGSSNDAPAVVPAAGKPVERRAMPTPPRPGGTVGLVGYPRGN
ncbi:DUF2628 domain-containing protein [Phyllobacterium phragmitis]|nr:DUF2628 domain-containing protein [Phyllobacterium phragmitis]